MTHPLILTLLLAALWGVVWALFLQFNRWGRWLAVRRTWATVVIGVGVDVLLLALVLTPHQVVTVFAVFAASALGIIGRSFLNEHKEDVQ
jgi:multidrug transporter EmrE-like cation transporter